MAGIEKIEAEIRRNAKNVRFSDLQKLCDDYFGDPRNSSGSHVVYKMPWTGDPRINIQNKGGMAKPYQVAQVLAAIDKLKESKDAGRR